MTQISFGLFYLIAFVIGKIPSEKKIMFEMNEKANSQKYDYRHVFGQSSKKSSYLITTFESNAAAEAILKRYKYLWLVSSFIIHVFGVRSQPNKKSKLEKSSN